MLLDRTPRDTNIFMCSRVSYIGNFMHISYLKCINKMFLQYWCILLNFSYALKRWRLSAKVTMTSYHDVIILYNSEKWTTPDKQLWRKGMPYFILKKSGLIRRIKFQTLMLRYVKFWQEMQGKYRGMCLYNFWLKRFLFRICAVIILIISLFRVTLYQICLWIFIACPRAKPISFNFYIHRIPCLCDVKCSFM